MRTSTVLRDPLVHFQIAEGEEKESHFGILTPEFKLLLLFVLFKIDCAKRHLYFPAGQQTFLVQGLIG